MEKDNIELVNPVIAYKLLLKEYLDRRPSGTRLKLAKALGTHKSFISQITNTMLRVPLPARHVPTMFRVCHFSTEEQARFLSIYNRSHHNQGIPLDEVANKENNVIRITLPDQLENSKREKVKQMVQQFADDLVVLLNTDENS